MSVLTHVFSRIKILSGGKGILKRKDLDRQLKQADWEISQGKKHDMAKHPKKPGIKIPLPRHNEIPEYTAQGILKEAGLK